MNFSISEIILVLLIALLVIKPDQLPEVAATVGRLIKSIRHLFAKMKNEMNVLIDEKPVERQREQ